MNTQSEPLSTKYLGNTSRLAHQEPKPGITTSDPALDLLMDFYLVDPPVIQASTSIRDTRSKMKLAETTMMVAVNADGEMVGVVTLKDILGVKPMSLANQCGVSIDDISVQDIVQPTTKLPAAQYADLQEATIGDLVSTFDEVHSEYLLIIDDDPATPGESCVRGLISASQLVHQLNITLDLHPPVTSSFSDLVNALRGRFG